MPWIFLVFPFFILDSFQVFKKSVKINQKSKILHFKAFRQTVHISSIYMMRGPNGPLRHFKGSHTKKVAMCEIPMYTQDTERMEHSLLSTLISL